jgi:hypothetical protein
MQWRDDRQGIRGRNDTGMNGRERVGLFHEGGKPSTLLDAAVLAGADRRLLYHH